MPGIIDTSLLLYAVNTDAREHRRAQQFLTASLSTNSVWYLTDGIIYEFLRVSTHARVFSHPLRWNQALSVIDALRQRENVTVLTAGADHWSILEQSLPKLRHPSGNIFFDIRTYVIMLEYSISTIYTADTDFLQFKGIRVVNPMA